MATNPIRRAVAAMLAFSLVFCCCHAHFLAGNVADAEDFSAAAGRAPACCAGCTDDADPARPGDDEPGGPSDGCQICCIKGTGQKDAAPVVLDVGPVAPLFTPPLALLPSTALRPELRPDRRALRCRVEPSTLLALRCALIV